LGRPNGLLGVLQGVPDCGQRRRARVEVAFPGAQGGGNRSETVQDQVRSVLHQNGVLVTEGFAFGAVGDDHGAPPGDGGHLAAGGKTRPAPTAQARLVEDCDELVGVGGRG